jgi:3-hydroxyisobutyrate dehydrogenase
MNSGPAAAPEPGPANPRRRASGIFGSAVAVLGTGLMGSAIARNLLPAGLPTTVRDRSHEATAALAAARAGVATSAQAAIRDADAVITMLPTAETVNSVIFTDSGPAFGRGAVWAQMGTIGVAATEGIDGIVSRLQPHVMFADSPVSGSKGPAEVGERLILASGLGG